MSERKTLPPFSSRLRFVGRFTYLLLALVLLLALFPFLEGDPQSFIIVRVLFSLVLWLALIISGGKRLTPFIAAFLPIYRPYWFTGSTLRLPAFRSPSPTDVRRAGLCGNRRHDPRCHIPNTQSYLRDHRRGTVRIPFDRPYGAGVFALLELMHPGNFRLPEPLHHDRLILCSEMKAILSSFITATQH